MLLDAIVSGGISGLTNQVRDTLRCILPDSLAVESHPYALVQSCGELKKKLELLGRKWHYHKIKTRVAFQYWPMQGGEGKGGVPAGKRGRVQTFLRRWWTPHNFVICFLRSERAVLILLLEEMISSMRELRCVMSSSKCWKSSFICEPPSPHNDVERRGGSVINSPP